MLENGRKRRRAYLPNECDPELSVADLAKSNSQKGDSPIL